MPAHTLMPIRERQIQKNHTNDVLYDTLNVSQRRKDYKGPPPGLHAGGGTRLTTENQLKYEVSCMPKNRTSLSV
eukprot:4804138-Amphidinium_carterae.1